MCQVAHSDADTKPLLLVTRSYRFGQVAHRGACDHAKVRVLIRPRPSATIAGILEHTMLRGVSGAGLPYTCTAVFFLFLR